MAWLIPRVGSDYVRDMNINQIKGTNIQDNVAKFNNLINSIGAEKRREEMHPLDLAFMEAKNRSLNLDNDQAEYGFNRLKRANNEYEDRTGIMRELENSLLSRDKQYLDNESTELKNLMDRFNYDETKRAYNDFEKNFGVNPNYYALSNAANQMFANPNYQRNGNTNVNANGISQNTSNVPSVINEDFIKDWNNKFSAAGVPDDPKRRAFMLSTIERESNFNPLAKPSQGSASGLGQITDDTKAGLERLYPELKLDRNKYNAGDVNEQLRYSNALYDDTRKTLTNMGIEPTEEAMNLAWFFGPAKAKAILQNPNSFQDIRSLIGEPDYSLNENYLSDGKGNPRTVFQVREQYNKENTERLEKYYNYYKGQGFTNKEAKEMAKEDVKADNQAEAQSMEQFSNYLFNPGLSSNPIMDKYRQDLLNSLTSYKKNEQSNTPSSNEINTIPNDNQQATSQELDDITRLSNALSSNDTPSIEEEKETPTWEEFFTSKQQQPIAQANQEDVNMLRNSLNPQQRSVVFRDDYKPINDPEQFITNAYNQQQEAKKYNDLGLRVGTDTEARDSDYVAISDPEKGNYLANIGELRKKYPHTKRIVDIPGIGRTIKGYLTEDDLQQGKHFSNKYLKENGYKIYNLDGTITDLGNYAENKNNTNDSWVSPEENIAKFYKNVSDSKELSEEDKANLTAQDVIRHNNIFWSLQGKNDKGNIELDEKFANAISSNIESQGRFLAMANIIGEDNLRRLSRNPEMLKALREFVTADFGSKNYKQVKENILKKYNIANKLGYKENFAPLLDAIGESGKEYLHFLMKKEKISQADIDNMRNVSPLTKIGNGKQSIELFNGYIPYKLDANGKQTSERNIGNHSYMAGLNLDVLGDPKFMKEFSQLNYDRAEQNKKKQINKQQYLNNTPSSMFNDSDFKKELERTARIMNNNGGVVVNRNDKYQPEVDTFLNNLGIDRIDTIGQDSIGLAKGKRLEQFIPKSIYEKNYDKLLPYFPTYEDFAIFMAIAGRK